MKKIFTILFCLITYVSFSQVYIGSDGSMHATGPFGVIHTKEASGAAYFVQTYAQLLAIPSYLRDTGMAIMVGDSLAFYTLRGGITNGNWYKTALNYPIACSVGFNNITGNATDNSSIVSQLALYQTILAKQNVLDPFPRYYNGQQALPRLDSAVWLLTQMEFYDSAHNGFLNFGDTTNLLLNHKGGYPNFDSFPCISGLFRYNGSTRGTRPPSTTTGMLWNMVGQDLKIDPSGIGNVTQLAFDFTHGNMYLRYYISPSWGSWVQINGSGIQLGETWKSGFSNSTVASTTTQYGYPFGTAGLGGTFVSKSFGVIEPGALSNAALFVSGTQDASGSLVATLYRNGSATSIQITVPAGGSAAYYQDNTHTQSVSAGDTYSWQFTNNATATSLTLVNASITFKQ